jgi:hypothetical protein
MTLVSPEDFELASGEGDLRARFRQGLHGLASSSDTDDTSKLTARAPTAETACFFPAANPNARGRQIRNFRR